MPCPTGKGSTENAHSTCKLTSGASQMLDQKVLALFSPTKGSIWINQPKFVKLHVKVKQEGGFGHSRRQGHNVQVILHFVTHQTKLLVTCSPSQLLVCPLRATASLQTSLHPLQGVSSGQQQQQCGNQPGACFGQWAKHGVLVSLLGTRGPYNL